MCVCRHLKYIFIYYILLSMAQMLVSADLFSAEERPQCGKKRTTGYFLDLLGSEERKEHVEDNLDSVNENKTVLGRDELEVDGMNHWPDLP
mmetsp:Transcript_2679/g.4023  ORF Transcript_2679/g.4023 Transcript_2679/m.4023 type:complete len:91 (+) Transcript_2679:2-274(+)